VTHGKTPSWGEGVRGRSSLAGACTRRPADRQREERSLAAAEPGLEGGELARLLRGVLGLAGSLQGGLLLQAAAVLDAGGLEGGLHLGAGGRAGLVGLALLAGGGREGGQHRGDQDRDQEGGQNPVRAVLGGHGQDSRAKTWVVQDGARGSHPGACFSPSSFRHPFSPPVPRIWASR